MGLFGTSASSATQNTDPAGVAAKKAAPRPASEGPAKEGPGKTVRGQPPARERILRDDAVTLSATVPMDAPKANLALREYKHSVAQDVAFVRETLRHKLAEYEMPAGTRMGISRNAFGRIEIDAQIPDQVRTRIEQDLSQSQAFKGAFDRLAVNQPTLDYVDNVMKLSQTYGIRNNVFDSLISRDGNFNGLQDIAHRYQSVRQTVSAEAMAVMDEKRYQFSVNARA